MTGCMERPRTIYHFEKNWGLLLEISNWFLNGTAKLTVFGQFTLISDQFIVPPCHHCNNAVFRISYC